MTSSRENITAFLFNIWQRRKLVSLNRWESPISPVGVRFGFFFPIWVRKEAILSCSPCRSWVSPPSCGTSFPSQSHVYIVRANWLLRHGAIREVPWPFVLWGHIISSPSSRNCPESHGRCAGTSAASVRSSPASSPHCVISCRLKWTDVIFAPNWLTKHLSFLSFFSFWSFSFCQLK